ncbi:bromodomain-containing protein DDB G0270170-like, partial [Aphis craccivora]
MSRLDKCCIQNCFGTNKSRFSIPKNSHSIWEMAIGKTLTKRSSVVIILSKKILLTLGYQEKAICLKKPRLREGAIPKLFLNSDHSIPSVNTSSSNQSILSEDQSLSENSLHFQDTSLNNYCSNLPQDILHVCIILVESLFSALKNKAAIKILPGWFRDISTNTYSKKLVISFQRKIEKKLIVTQDSKILIYILNKSISPEQQQLYFPMICQSKTTIQNVQSAIDSINTIKICYGAVLISTYPNIKTSFGPQYEGTGSHWKHTNCSTILSSN